MLSSVEQAFVGRDEKRAPLKKPACEAVNELTRIISNEDGVFNYFIRMKDYIVKPTRSLRAE